MGVLLVCLVLSLGQMLQGIEQFVIVVGSQVNDISSHQQSQAFRASLVLMAKSCITKSLLFLSWRRINECKIRCQLLISTMAPYIRSVSCLRPAYGHLSQDLCFCLIIHNAPTSNFLQGAKTAHANIGLIQAAITYTRGFYDCAHPFLHLLLLPNIITNTNH
jgi:hypothetical protein